MLVRRNSSLIGFHVVLPRIYHLLGTSETQAEILFSLVVVQEIGNRFQPTLQLNLIQYNVKDEVNICSLFIRGGATLYTMCNRTRA